MNLQRPPPPFPFPFFSTHPTWDQAKAAGAKQSLIVLHEASLRSAVLSTEQRIRMAALQAVDVVLRGGALHPMSCSAALLSLGADADVQGRTLAHEIIARQWKKVG